MITTKNIPTIQFQPSADGTYENRYYNLQEEQSLILSRISHDLLNSLTLLSCSYQFIESQHPETANYKYWSDLKSDTDYIQHYLVSLSNYNRAAILRNRTCDLGKILKDAVHASSLQYPDMTTFLAFKNNHLSIPYYGDDMRLFEAISQVIQNAFEALSKKEGAKEKKLSVSFKKTNQFYEIRIKDNADGIDETSLLHVCEPFFTEKSQHVGLGLPICSRILYAHNGHLNIESKKGRGTTVTLCLPVMKKEMPDQTDEACQNHPSPSCHLS